jgi:hypothetical protein
VRRSEDGLVLSKSHQPPHHRSHYRTEVFGATRRLAKNIITFVQESWEAYRMNKTDYILKSLQKISHKKWELFVISRIIHKLDDPEIEFVTQQLVRLPDGRRALTDLYFPQLSIHLEVDERHHFEQNAGDDLGLSYVPDDQRREQDIVQITEHELHRIRVCNENGDLDFTTVAELADDFVDVIRSKKQAKLEQHQFEP